MTKFKGPLFPSFINARPSTQTRMQWKAHCGKQAQLRNLRQACRKIRTSYDPATIAAVARVREAVKDEPMPEFGELHLIFAALDASDQTGETWVTAMTYLMDQFDNMRLDARG